MESEPVRVLVVDDNQAVRSSVILCLEIFDDLQYAGEAADGQEAVEQCAALLPDVVLMDITMPVMNGVEATRHIQADHPQVRVLGYTSLDDPAVIDSMLKAGAIACISKNVTVDELANALRRVARS